MLPVLFSVATFASTFSGGLIALRNQQWLRRIMGFTAGVLLGVVAFDLFPEITDLGNVSHSMIALVVGFLAFHTLEKSLLIHHGHEAEYGKHHHPHVGVASALALAGHSFLDGIGIGLGFKVSHSVGIAVALAVIAHDFTDGLNTVVLMLVNKNSRRRALRLLLLDAAAPVLGVVATLFFTLSTSALAVYLGFFAGFLLYIGASDILPEAHSEGSSMLTIALTVLGAAFMYGASRLV